jgi:hypothetical protein
MHLIKQSENNLTKNDKNKTQKETSNKTQKKIISKIIQNKNDNIHNETADVQNKIKDKQHETPKQDNKQMRDTNEQKAVPNVNVNAKRVVTKSKKRLNRERIENELKNMTDGPLEESSHSDTDSTSSVGSEHFSDGSDSDSEIADEEVEKCNTADEIHKLMESKRSKKVNTLKFENANANYTSNLNDVNDVSNLSIIFYSYNYNLFFSNKINNYILKS